MPRIAAVLGAFVLVACGIGLNIARYPVVWEMVNGPARGMLVSSEMPEPKTVAPPGPEAERQTSPQPDSRSEPSPAPPGPPAAKPAVAQRPIPIPATPVCANGVCAVPLAPGDDPQQDAAQPVQGVAPPPADAHQLPSAEAAAGPDSERPLVPVVPAGIEQPGGEPSNTDQEVRRLPPADATAMLPPGPGDPQSPPIAMPIYPRTGR